MYYHDICDLICHGSFVISFVFPRPITQIGSKLDALRKLPNSTHPASNFQLFPQRKDGSGE